MEKEKYTPAAERYEKTDYRRCGNSGIMLPPVSLGFWHNFGYSDSYSEAEKIVRYAFDNGITHFDLANNYGPPAGSAEENFGHILKHNLQPYRDEILITTKAGHLMWKGPYGDGGSRKYLMSSLDQSLKRMGIEYVDIFYSHRYDPFTPLDETLQALSDMVKQGKALYIGLSKYPADQLRYALDFLRKAGTPVLVYQDKYNLMARTVEQTHLPLTAAEGTGFVAFSPLAQGILTDKYLHGIPAASRAARPDGFLKPEQITENVRSQIRELKKLAEKRNQSVADTALAWLLKDSRVTSVIVGARTVEQLSDSLNAVQNIEFSPEELTQIDQIFTQ